MNDWSMKVCRPWGQFSRNDECDYVEGTVITPHGLVDVYSQTGDPHTSLRTVARGRWHTRSFDKAYTTRGLVTLAARYAAELAKGQTK